MKAIVINNDFGNEVQGVYLVPENIELKNIYLEFTKWFYLSKGLKERELELLSHSYYPKSDKYDDLLYYKNDLEKYITEELKGSLIKFESIEIQSNDSYY